MCFVFSNQEKYGGSDGKESACNAGNLGSIPGTGRYTREGKGSPLQYSCLKNSINREAWWATVHGVAVGAHTLLLLDYRVVNAKTKQGICMNLGITVEVTTSILGQEVVREKVTDLVFKII